jgi:hypothetical protein
MQTLLPPWPREIPRVFRPIARLTTPTDSRESPALSRLAARERLAIQRARQVADQAAVNQCSGTMGTWAECFFANTADYTAIASFTTETSLLSGTNNQPTIPALFFNQGGRGFGRAVTLRGKGVLSTTGTPTYLLTIRFGTTSGPSYISGTAVGVTAAITTASGVTNKWFEFQLDLICTVCGIGTGNTTLAGSGYWKSPGGFASPFIYPIEPTTPDTATWTATIDSSATQYVNISVTSSASSASNTLTLKQLLAFGWN